MNQSNSEVLKLKNLIKDGISGKNKGLSTGSSKLDSLINGWQRSRYYLLFGATSSAKTSFILYSLIYKTLKDNPDKNVKIIYWSLEMSSTILFTKLMSIYIYDMFHIKLSMNKILSSDPDNPLNQEEIKLIAEALKWLVSIEKNFIIFDRGLSAKRLYADIMPLLTKEWGKIIINDGKEVYVPNDPNIFIFGIVDHLSLVKPEEGRTLKQEMDLVSAYFITLRNKFGISPVVLMQQNRDSGSSDRRKMDLQEPTLLDSKDSSSPNQDSDVVLAIYNPFRDKLKYYRDYKIMTDDNGQGLGDRFRSIIVLKNRYGISDRAMGFSFFGEIGMFNELPKGTEMETDYTQYLTL